MTVMQKQKYKTTRQDLVFLVKSTRTSYHAENVKKSRIICDVKNVEIHATFVEGF